MSCFLFGRLLPFIAVLYSHQFTLSQIFFPSSSSCLDLQSGSAGRMLICSSGLEDTQICGSHGRVICLTDEFPMICSLRLAGQLSSPSRPACFSRPRARRESCKPPGQQHAQCAALLRRAPEPRVHALTSVCGARQGGRGLVRTCTQLRPGPPIISLISSIPACRAAFNCRWSRLSAPSDNGAATGPGRYYGLMNKAGQMQ